MVVTEELEGFEFDAVIERKIPEIFINKHNGNEVEFDLYETLEKRF